MRPSYPLKARSKFPSDPKAEGTTETRLVYVRDDGTRVVEPSRALPELGPKRAYPDRGFKWPLVLDIKGRRFKVTVDSGWDDDSPAPGVVTFEETTEPETPFEVWDAKAALENRIKFIKRDIQELADLGETPYTWLAQDLKRYEADLAAESYEGWQPGCNVSAFGQPNFIQNKVYPTHEGKAAYALLTLETGWGDCGNENYMVALDADGYPVAVFHEASCC